MIYNPFLPDNLLVLLPHNDAATYIPMCRLCLSITKCTNGIYFSDSTLEYLSKCAALLATNSDAG